MPNRDRITRYLEVILSGQPLNGRNVGISEKCRQPTRYGRAAHFSETAVY